MMGVKFKRYWGSLSPFVLLYELLWNYVRFVQNLHDFVIVDFYSILLMLNSLLLL